MGEWTEFETLDREGRFAAYRAAPGDAPKAAIIVIQEIFGVNAGIRRKADDWAGKGYLAIAPDMFWRFAPRYDVDPDIPEQMQDAFEVRKEFDLDQAVADVAAVIRAVRTEIGGGRIGIVGFCMGGSVAYLAATRTDIDAAIGYYGGQIAPALGEASAIARPLLLHFGTEDAHIDAAARSAIHAALDANAHVEIVEYDGVGHGFADTFGRRRNEAAAPAADARTEAFFAEHLA